MADSRNALAARAAGGRRSWRSSLALEQHVRTASRLSALARGVSVARGVRVWRSPLCGAALIQARYIVQGLGVRVP